MKRIVVIDNPLASFDNALVRDIFTKTIHMKLRGFRQFWSEWYVPACKTDFVGTNMVLCEEKHGELTPISAYRSITKERCDKYNITFPGLTLCNNTGSTAHIQALSNFVKEHESQPLAYGSSFTIFPFLEKRDHVDAVKALVPLFAYYHLHFKVNKSIALGAVKTKTDKMYHKMGLFPIKYKGKELENPVFPEYDNQPFEVQTLTGLTDHCLEVAHEYRKLWMDRIYFPDISGDRGTAINELKKYPRAPKLVG